MKATRLIMPEVFDLRFLVLVVVDLENRGKTAVKPDALVLPSQIRFAAHWP